MCSIINIESRDSFCHEIISPMSYELSRKKFHKKLAEIFFDFILAIIDLHIIEASTCACRILDISEFYPWKQLDKQIIHLVQSCVTYDDISTDSSSSKLDDLTKILCKIHERAKTNQTIFYATHQTAVQAILKWSSIINKDTGNAYSTHVFKMGEEMTKLVDLQQVTVDLCIQLLEILQKRIDNNDEPNDLNNVDDYFLQVSLFRN